LLGPASEFDVNGAAVHLASAPRHTRIHYVLDDLARVDAVVGAGLVRHHLGRAVGLKLRQQHLALKPTADAARGLRSLWSLCGVHNHERDRNAEATLVEIARLHERGRLAVERRDRRWARRDDGCGGARHGPPYAIGHKVVSLLPHPRELLRMFTEVAICCDAEKSLQRLNVGPNHSAF
jgi:hypothetical protein